MLSIRCSRQHRRGSAWVSVSSDRTFPLLRSLSKKIGNHEHLQDDAHSVPCGVSFHWWPPSKRVPRLTSAKLRPATTSPDTARASIDSIAALQSLGRPASRCTGRTDVLRYPIGDGSNAKSYARSGSTSRSRRTSPTPSLEAPPDQQLSAFCHGSAACPTGVPQPLALPPGPARESGIASRHPGERHWSSRSGARLAAP